MFKTLLQTIAFIAALSCVALSSLSAAEPPPRSPVTKVGVFNFDESQNMPFYQNKTLYNNILVRYILGDKGGISVMETKKGAIVEMHQHASEQLTWITKGKVKATAAGKDYIVSAGEIIVLPANVPHCFEALKNTTSVSFYSPVRHAWKNSDYHN